MPNCRCRMTKVWCEVKIVIWSSSSVVLDTTLYRVFQETARMFSLKHSPVHNTKEILWIEDCTTIHLLIDKYTIYAIIICTPGKRSSRKKILIFKWTTRIVLRTETLWLDILGHVSVKTYCEETTTDGNII